MRVSPTTMLIYTFLALLWEQWSRCSNVLRYIDDDDDRRRVSHQIGLSVVNPCLEKLKKSSKYVGTKADIFKPFPFPQKYDAGSDGLEHLSRAVIKILKTCMIFRNSIAHAFKGELSVKFRR